jgi:hypothetical protein
MTTKDLFAIEFIYNGENKAFIKKKNSENNLSRIA